MITQDVKNPRVNGIGGILLILGIVGVIFAGLIVSTILKPYIGALASTVSVWLLGIAVAAYVTRRYVTQFRYSADSRRFRIERLYGDRARFMLEFSLSNIIKTGTPDEIKTAYPGAKRDNACIFDSSLTTFAVAYKYDGEIRILLAQPDERMRAKLGIREK